MLISADSHVVEPGDLWQQRLAERYREQAPRAVQDPENHHWYLTAPGVSRGVDLTLSTTAGHSPAEVDAALQKDPNAVVGVLGGADPVERLNDLWRDGTMADVVYPTAGLTIFQLEDPELQEACAAVYNDWLAEFCSADPDRLVGLALIATWNVERGAAELRRARDLGLRGAIIWTAPPEGDSFFDRRYEPLWATAADLGMPVSLHTLAGRRGSRGLATFNTSVRDSFYFSFEVRQELQRSLCELIASGVFERHPELRIVAAEGGIEYAAMLERRLDSGYAGFWSKLDHELTMKPSEYFRRNVYLTYIDDAVGLNNLRFTGADHFMWSSDYPHGAASWPNSAASISADAEGAGLDQATIERLTCTNVAELYRIPLDVVAEPSPHVRVPSPA